MKQAERSMKIDFLVPGFSKCGTTTLCALLAEHPDIFIPPDVKEPCLFNRDNYENSLYWYQSLFSNAPHQALLGEGSTIYTVAETEIKTRDRIKKLYPEVKLIFIARDPVTRLESSYKYLHHTGQKYGVECPYSIGEAIRGMPSMLPDTRYGSRLENYLAVFPKEQIHVVLMEDLAADAESVLNGCFKFLGVDSNIAIPDISRRLNKGDSKYYDSKELRKMRNSIWEPETGIPLSKIPLNVQDQFLPQLGFRKSFDDTVIEWSKEDEEYLIDQIGMDIHKFLTMTDYPVTKWSRFQKLV